MTQADPSAAASASNTASPSASKTAPLYEALARAVIAEGVTTQFVLMGDGNMHFSTAFDGLAETQSIAVRHEHCAVAAATAYHVATGGIALASVTCGPGLTQITTALPAAVRARIPVVIFAGETPINARFYNQAIEQAPFITACGAPYIQAHAMSRVFDRVREAFHIARTQRTPVVLAIPYDMQKQAVDTAEPYVPSERLYPDGGRPHADPERIAVLVERLAQAKCPVILGGRGVLRAQAQTDVVALADRVGALLANTLPVRGLFDHHPYGLGVMGGYSAELTREIMAEADLVVAIGAGLSYYTVDGGKLFPNAHIIQIDEAPSGLRDGMRAADLYITADAQAASKQALAAFNARYGAQGGAASSLRTPALARRIAQQVADSATFDIPAGVVDPRAVIQALDHVIPKDWDIISGSGHQAYFNSQMRGRPGDRFVTIREFGAIGNGLSYALGVAAARRQGAQGRIVLIEGDGGLLMHIQELETLKRQGLRVLLCCLNDGAYGSEIHKLRAEGLDDSGAVFGRPPLDAVARGFGLRGAVIKDVSDIAERFAAFEAQDQAELWNIHISDDVTAPTMRSIIKRGHGVM
ncbi:MAG: thiamine pyrophosphate-binding protein [Pseudomonadota bacterium]